MVPALALHCIMCLAEQLLCFIQLSVRVSRSVTLVQTKSVSGLFSDEFRLLPIEVIFQPTAC